MKYKVVIFDLDGTLLNSLEDLHDSVNYIQKKYNFPVTQIEDTRSFVGDGIGKLIERSLNTKENADLYINDFKQYYNKNMDNKTRAYNGIYDMLKELKARGHKLAVLSNKIDTATKQLVEKYFGEYISVALGERLNVKRKPCPDGIFELLKIFNEDISNCVYVGDSEVDIKTSQNAGVDFIAVSWGFREKEKLIQSGGENIIDEPCDILEIV